MVRLSFKDKLLDYCENYAKHDCTNCGFFKQCNHISETRMPSRWREDEFKVMHSELVKHVGKLTSDLAILVVLVCDQAE